MTSTNVPCGPTKLELNVTGIFTVRLLPAGETVAVAVFTTHWLLLKGPPVPGAAPVPHDVNASFARYNRFAVRL